MGDRPPAIMTHGGCVMIGREHGGSNWGFQCRSGRQFTVYKKSGRIKVPRPVFETKTV
jgi:hypothetical protein